MPEVLIWLGRFALAIAVCAIAWTVFFVPGCVVLVYFDEVLEWWMHRR
jgi:hypothetical protein